MPVQQPSLTRRACVLAKIETVAGTDAVPAEADAILVAAPDFTTDLQVLERDYVRNDLSPLGVSIGRKLAGMKFTVELRSNGLTNSGLIGDVAKVGRLLRACGMSETAVAAAGTPGAVEAQGTHAVTASWAIANTNTSKNYFDYLISVVLGGASATAKIRVSELNGYVSTLTKNDTVRVAAASAAGTAVVDATDPLAPTIAIGGTWVIGEKINYNINGYSGYITVASATTTVIATALAAAITALNADIDAAGVSSDVNITYTNAMNGVVVTSGTTAVALTGSGVEITPTWTGNLALGQQWIMRVSPTGIRYLPVSDDFETITLYMFKDGLLHKMTASQGNMMLRSQAGNFGTMEFTFVGQYIDPVDRNVPANPSYETTSPPTFELAKIAVDSQSVAIDNISLDMNNRIVPRPDANYPDGYNGVRLTSRLPQGGIDPEQTKTGDYNFWQSLADSRAMNMSCRFGKNNGNIIWLKAPKVQYSGMSYKDRDGISVLDAGLRFGRDQGNDEFELFFA